MVETARTTLRENLPLCPTDVQVKIPALHFLPTPRGARPELAYDWDMKRIALVGHCGPDSSYLSIAAKKAVADAEIVRINRSSDLDNYLAAGPALLLVNRALDGDFPDDDTGISLIARLRTSQPNVSSILVSNYADAQEEAVKAGALPGFGKKEVGSAKVIQLIQNAAAVAIPAGQS
jgi:two-component system, chemotaxis family, chemotaxis protein CheY